MRSCASGTPLQYVVLFSQSPVIRFRRFPLSICAGGLFHHQGLDHPDRDSLPHVARGEVENLPSGHHGCIRLLGVQLEAGAADVPMAQEGKTQSIGMIRPYRLECKRNAI
jgi:hypothetical protein